MRRRLGTVGLLLFLGTNAWAQGTTPPPPVSPTIDAGPAAPTDAGVADSVADAAPPAAAEAPKPEAPRPAAPVNSTPPAAAEPVPLPPEDEEAQGKCETPRQAWLQLLYWLQRGKRWEPDKAAACFDTAQLSSPEAAGKLAVQLKEVLDANHWILNVDEIPIDPSYIDPGTRKRRYEDPAVEGRGVVLHRRGKRWLFTPETLRKIPDMYPALTVQVVDALPPWFRTRFLGVEVWKYLGIIVLFFIAFTLQKLVVFVIRRYLSRLVGRANLRYLDSAVGLADRPIGGLVMAGVFYVGFPKLLFPPGLSQIAFIATQAIAAYSLVWLGYRMIDVLAEFLGSKAEASQTKLDDQLVPLVSKTLKVFVSVVGGIFVLQNLNVDVGSLLAGLGLGGLAFALAAKDTVANFFGSVMIFIDKPFQIGDWVNVAGAEGTVEEVGFRTSRIRTFYNSLITLPNSLVTGNIVDNYGARKYRRYSTTLGLAYDTPPEKIQAFCEAVRATIAGMPNMRRDYYLVEFKEFADSSLNIMLYCFMETTTWNEELRTRTNLNLEILRIAGDLGVSFAFPTQTLHVDSLVKPGDVRPSHSGPSTPEELVAIIEGHAKDGKLAKFEGEKLTSGYSCD